jgi:hypothetical protein
MFVHVQTQRCLAFPYDFLSYPYICVCICLHAKVLKLYIIPGSYSGADQKQKQTNVMRKLSFLSYKINPYSEAKLFCGKENKYLTFLALLVAFIVP